MGGRRLSSKFREALVFAAEAHDGQGRKGTRVPYVAHLLGVTAIVLEYGGNEKQAIAALLHDAVEDQGGDRMRRKIRERFGKRVAAMVDECTDTDITPKPPWKQRKLDYLASIPEHDDDSVLVAMADKLHNARSLAQGLRRDGVAVFERFKGRREGTLWYYRALVDAFEAREPHGPARRLLDELRHTVALLERTTATLDELQRTAAAMD